MVLIYALVARLREFRIKIIGDTVTMMEAEAYVET